MVNSRKIAALFAALALIMCLALTVCAQSYPDLTSPVSLTVTILDTGSKKGVSGGTVEIYRVAGITFDPYSGYSLTLTEDFLSCGLALDTVGTMTAAANAETAKSLSTFVTNGKLAAQGKATPDSQGDAKFAAIPMGLYLVVQTEAARDHKVVAPFLVSAPGYDEENDLWIYEVNASPKVGTSDYVEPPKPGMLPQTGQLWWPVFALGTAGTVLVVFGAYRRKRDAE